MIKNAQLVINKTFLVISKIREYNIFLKKNIKYNEQFKYLKTKHSFHLVDPSPWPLVGSLGGFIMTSGFVLYIHKFSGGGHIFLLGFCIIFYVMYTWWRDVIREVVFEEQHTATAQRGMRLGMILFIVLEVMFFFAFLLFSIKLSCLDFSVTNSLLVYGIMIFFFSFIVYCFSSKKNYPKSIVSCALNSKACLNNGKIYLNSPFLVKTYVD